MAEVALRPVDDPDLDALFDQMRDPESVRMAAFTAENPDDRTAFDVHMPKVRTLPEVTNRIITLDGRLVGSIASFVVDGDTEVTYPRHRGIGGDGNQVGEVHHAPALRPPHLVAKVARPVPGAADPDVTGWRLAQVPGEEPGSSVDLE